MDWDAMRWLRHPAVLAAGMLASLLVLVVSALLVPIVIARLPDDYFVRRQVGNLRRSHPAMRLLVDGLRTLGGLVLVLMGIGMLVLPGQGVLTIVAGLALLPFPGKRALQRRLLRAPGVRSLVAAIRRKAGRAPLQLQEP